MLRVIYYSFLIITYLLAIIIISVFQDLIFITKYAAFFVQEINSWFNELLLLFKKNLHSYELLYCF